MTIPLTVIVHKHRLMNKNPEITYFWMDLVAVSNR